MKMSDYTFMGNRILRTDKILSVKFEKDIYYNEGEVKIDKIFAIIEYFDDNLNRIVKFESEFENSKQTGWFALEVFATDLLGDKFKANHALVLSILENASTRQVLEVGEDEEYDPSLDEDLEGEPINPEEDEN